MTPLGAVSPRLINTYIHILLESCYVITVFIKVEIFNFLFYLFVYVIIFFNANSFRIYYIFNIFFYSSINDLFYT
jgi:hypothetical protein